MKVSVNDYVIFSGSKPTLAKVTSLSPLRVKLEPDENLKQEIVDLYAENILCVLGKHNADGTVYGINTANRYVDTQEIALGDLSMYGEFAKQYKVLRSAFRIVHKRLTQCRLPDDLTVTWKACHLRGSMTGLCKIKNDKCEISIDMNKCTVEDLPTVIAHEIGHYYWPKLSAEAKQTWLRAYLRYVKPRSFTQSQVEELKTALEDSSPREVMKSLEDDDLKFLLRHFVKYLCREFHVSQSELNYAWTDEKATFLSMLPTSVKINEFEPVISSYACKNYKETFAEAFAYFVVGKKLPNVFNRLVKRSIEIL